MSIKILQFKNLLRQHADKHISWLYTFKKLLVLIVVAATISSTAQDFSRIDSLQQNIQNDSIFNLRDRLNFTLRLIDIFSDSNIEKADNYTLSAIDLTEQLNDSTKLISLLMQYAESKSDQCNYLDANKAYQEVKDIILKSGSGKEKANIYYSIGINFFDWGKYIESQKYFDKALEEYSAIKDKKGIALSLTELSSIASNFSNYVQAIGYMQRARDIYIEIDDLNNLAHSNQRLGVILEKWSEVDRALDYYTQAYNHFAEENNQFEKMQLLYHIGNIYLKQYEFGKALDNYNQAIRLDSEVNNKKLLSIGYNNIGKTYFAMKEYDTALFYQEKALTIKYEVDDKKHIAISNLNIGVIYFAINNLTLAEESALQCLQLANENKLKEIEMEALELLSEINGSKGNYNKSYDYLEQYIELNDEVFSTESQTMINDLLIRYQAEKFEKENEILKQNEAISNLELERGKDTTLFTIILLVFIIILALIIIFFINSRTVQSKRNYSVLAKKNKEITNQQEKLSNLNKELVSSREQYRSIVENATIGMYQTLPNGKIKFANIGLINMLEYNNFSELSDTNLNKDHKNREAFINLLEKNKVVSGREDIWTRRDGTSMYVNESAWIVTDNNGETKHYEGIVEDISKRKEAEIALKDSEKELQIINNALKEKNKEFEEARNEAISANNIKSQFLANVSHEIRTPMNSIIGFSELLSKIITDKKQLLHIEAIKSSSTSLLTLLNDILDLSKIQANELEIVFESMSFANVIKDIEQVFKLRFIEKKLEFKTLIGNNVPPNVLLDQVRIRQVLFNLIGNSIKFTDSGSITLAINSKVKNTDTIDLLISIADTGIGIPESEQKTIFKAFKQSKNRLNKSHEGTGLGLSISKRLVEAMGGKIKLDSQLGKGSTFSIRFPKIKISPEIDPITSSIESKDIKTKINKEGTDALTIVTDDILALDESIKSELIDEFRKKWMFLNNNHVINEKISFAKTLLLFAKRKNNPSLVKFCENLLFSLNNFDIENIDKLMKALGLVLNIDKFDNNDK